MKTCFVHGGTKEDVVFSSFPKLNVFWSFESLGIGIKIPLSLLIMIRRLAENIAFP